MTDTLDDLCQAVVHRVYQRLREDFAAQHARPTASEVVAMARFYLDRLADRLAAMAMED